MSVTQSPNDQETRVAEDVLQFRLHKSSATQPYHWTLNSVANGQVICTSENYARKASAKESMDLVHAHAKDTKYVELTGES